MAGSWLTIVEGFAGMRIKNNSPSFYPSSLPKEWEELMFKIIFRQNIYTIKFNKSLFQCSLNINKTVLYIRE